MSAFVRGGVSAVVSGGWGEMRIVGRETMMVEIVQVERNLGRSRECVRMM